MSRFFAVGVTMLMVFGSVAKAADMENNVHGSFFLLSESRESVASRPTYSNFELMLGFDRLLDSDQGFFAGVRGGVYREKVLTSMPVIGNNLRPFIGIQAYKYIHLLLPILGLKLGFAADMLFGGSNYALGVFTGAMAGVRLEFWDNYYAEVPVELGVFPFFNGVPIFAKIGLQVGMHL